MRELSIFVDESGSDGLSDRHYLLTVVMHDQSENIADSIAAYEGALRAKGAPGHTLPCVAAHERQGPVLGARPEDAQDDARLVPSLLI